MGPIMLTNVHAVLETVLTDMTLSGHHFTNVDAAEVPKCS